MQFRNWLSIALFILTPLFHAIGAETDYFRQCADCSVTELDSFFNDTSAPYEAFKLVHTKDARGAAVLFHGLSDSPYYMKDIAKLYFDNGYDVYVPLAKAHGNNPRWLESVGFQEWNRHAETIIDEVSQKYRDRILVGGLSNGGLTSVVAALKPTVKRKIESLLLISPALGLPGSANFKFKIMSWIEYAKRLLNSNIINGYFRKLLATKVKKNMCEGCTGEIRYSELPLNGPLQLLKNTRNLLRYSKYGSIEIPTVMVLTSDDKTISLDTSVKQFKTLFSGEKKLIWLQSGDKTAAVTPKGIPSDQLIVIPTKDVLSHVLSIRDRGLAGPGEVNSAFDSMAEKIKSLLLNRGQNMCLSFYR